MSTTTATWGIPPSPSSYANWVQECRIAKNVFLIEEHEHKLKEKEETHQAKLECRAKEKGKPYVSKPKKQKVTKPDEKDSTPSVPTAIIGETVVKATKRQVNLVLKKAEKPKGYTLTLQKQQGGTK